MPNHIDLDSKDLRPNFKIISSSSEPVYTSPQSVNNPTLPTVTEELAVAYNKLGKRFSVNTGVQTIGNGSTTQYLRTGITIPSNVTVYIDRLRAGTSSSSVVTLWSLSSNTVDTTNTLSRICTNVGSGKTSSITEAYYDISTTSLSGSLILTIVLTGGTYETEFGGRIIFPSSRYLGIQVQNTATSAAGTACMIHVSWWEV